MTQEAKMSAGEESNTLEEMEVDDEGKNFLNIKYF